MAYINSNAAAVFGTSGNDEIYTWFNSVRGQLVYGGLGNDNYFIDVLNTTLGGVEDVISEAANAGTDTVNVPLYQSSGSDFSPGYTLGDNLENLTVDYAYANTDHIFNLGGNNLANVITVSDHNPQSRFDIDGGAGNDKITAGTGNDSLNGGTGIDTLIGGKGSDTYFVDNTADVITELSANGFDTVYASTNYTLSANVESLVLTGYSNVSGTGNASENYLTGNAGNNTLSGLAGSDDLYGGNGNDTLLGGAGDDNLYGDNGNDSLVGGDGSDDLYGQDGNDTLLGGAGNDNLYGSQYSSGLIDKLDGGAGDDRYYEVTALDIVTDSGIGGNDTLYAGEQLIGDLGAGIEDLTMSNIATSGRGNALNNFISGNNSDNYIFGLAGDDVLNGLSGNDVLLGDAGNDVLDGGLGNDLLIGGAGNDIYIMDSVNDAAGEGLSGGTDSIFSSADVKYNVGNIENITLTGSENISAVGNDLANNITGNAGNNILFGLAGDDSLNGGAGSDNLIGDLGKDTLNGGAGLDTLAGGDGNDVYIVDSNADTVNEYGAVADIDTVQSSAFGFDLSLAGRVAIEKLELTGSAYNGYGNALANTITGNARDNYLFGGAGADTLIGGLGEDSLNGGVGADSMTGGAGNDDYNVDNVGDKVTELAGQGDNDRISTTLNSFSLLSNGVNVESLYFDGAGNFNATGNGLNNIIYGGTGNDTLIGGYGNDDLYGITGSDSLIGGAGNDTLNGGVGIDTLIGGAGNDYYYYDGTDSITELAGAGTDTIESTGSVNISLTDALANIENARLSFVAIAGTNITGNGLNNVLIGSNYSNTLLGEAGNDDLVGYGGSDTLVGGAGNDTLNGGTFADSMTGGAGDDVYYVDEVGDIVMELLNGGTDSVFSSVSFVLTANVENLTLTGNNDNVGFGNALANVITGDDSNNNLDGYGGNDRLIGGAGNDFLSGAHFTLGGQGIDTLIGGAGDDGYYWGTGDTITELAGGGTDYVYANNSYTLGANIENAYSSSNAAISLTGNALDNRLFSGSFNDTLIGGAGNDFLGGGNGLDVLTGGTGNDTFVINADGVETVTDYALGTDRIVLNIGGLTFNGAGNTLTANQFDLTIGGLIDTNTRIIYDQLDGQLFYDVDGLGGVGAVLIADFTDGLALNAISIFGA